MDNQSIVSLMGTSASSGTSSNARADKGDADAFSSAMNDAVSGKTGSTSGDGKSLINSNKAHKKPKPKHNKAASQDVTAVDGKAEAKVTAKTVGSLEDYLYHIVYKDPATLTIGERQAFHLGQFSRDRVGLTELQRMLSGRGLNIRDLSFSQLALLTSRSSRHQISGTLDSLLKQGQLDGSRGHLPAAGQAAASMHQHLPQSLEQMVGQAAAAQGASRTAQSQRQQQRQSIVDQILAHIEVRNVANQTELNLRLNPEYLGDVRIKLTHSEDGVNAHFETTSRLTRDLLKESGDDLVSQVRSRGIRLGHMDVALVEDVV